MSALAPVRPIRSSALPPADLDSRSMVGRISAILDAFEPTDPTLSIGEISRRTDLPKSTVSRIVIDLVAYRMLERVGRDVRLGTRIFEMGESVRRPHYLRHLAAGPMATLRSTLDLTAHLAILEWPDVIFLEVLPARQRLFPTFRSRVARMPAHATAVGKVLLACSPEYEERVRQVTHLVRVAPQTITRPDVLRAELEVVRRSGFSVERGESRSGAACVAAPVLDGIGRPIAALSVTGQEADVDVNSVVPVLLAAAAAMRSELTGDARSRD